MRPTQVLLCSVLLAVLAACAPTPPPLPPIATNPIDPRVGVHTRLTDEPDPANVDRTLDMVHQMGAGSIVEYFPWAYFQPGPTTWDWQHADLVVNEAVRQSLRVYARIDMVPDWARPTGSPSRLLPPDETAAYAAAVAAFAERYGDRLAGIIVWNEPNLSFEWGFQSVDPARYVDLLQQTSVAVKAVSPGTRILFAGLAPTLDKSYDALGGWVTGRSAYNILGFGLGWTHNI